MILVILLLFLYISEGNHCILSYGHLNHEIKVTTKFINLNYN